MNIIETKLQLIDLLLCDLESEHPRLERGAGRLHTVLLIYKKCLMRKLFNLPFGLDLTALMQHTICEAGSLLTDLCSDDRQRMNGWQHSPHPLNSAQALGNFLTRLVLELAELIDSPTPIKRQQVTSKRSNLPIPQPMKAAGPSQQPGAAN